MSEPSGDEPPPPQTARYAVREDDNGSTVFDVWTGKAVVLAQGRQTGLDPKAAYALAAQLSARAEAGERGVLQ